MKKLLIHLILLSVFCSCSISEQKEVIDKEVLEKSALIFMENYGNAWNSDMDSMLQFYSPSDDFFFYTEGKFVNYDEMTVLIHNLFERKSTFKGGPFVNHQIRILSDKSAIFASELDYIINDSVGNEVHITGAATYVLIYDDNSWKIIYGMGCGEPMTEK